MWIIIAVLAAVGIVVAVLYNGLINKKNQVDNSFATIDTMLKKRYDLIPNLVDAVQEYMKHEAGVLKEVTAMRAKATSGNLTQDETVDLNNRIGRAMRGIMISVENYPDLKASTNFLQLQGALNEVEEQISAARRAYNANVTDLNNAIEMFPTNLLAALMNLQRRQLFEADEEERENPDVGDLFNKA